MNKRNLLPMTKMKMLLTVLLFTMSKVLFAQSLASGFTTSNNSSSKITFNFQNTNTYPVTITDIASVVGSGTQNVQAYYNTTPINGAPLAIDAANGWILFGSATVTTGNTSTVTPILSGLSLVVPAGTTYGITVASNTMAYYTIPSPPTTYTFSLSGCNIITGLNIGYGGSLTGTNFYPRGFVGTVTFTGSATNTTPTFTSSTPQALTVCQNSGATDITGLLHVNDADAAQTETWSQLAAPSHGTLNFTSATATSGSTNITPGGTITYTPTVGYNGTDAFTVQVSDGTDTANMVVNVTVNPTPDVTATADQVVCNNTATTAVAFSGSVSGTTFNWTNNTTSVALAASNSGDIASFTATNTGTAPVTASIIVTPVAATCIGKNDTFNIQVNPTPTVNAIANQHTCPNTATTAINFTGAVAGTVYTWTNDNLLIGLANNGTGNIPSFTATNTDTVSIYGTVVVTPTYTNAGVTCTGTSKTFYDTVNSAPFIYVEPLDSAFCLGTPATFTVRANGKGLTYRWQQNTGSGFVNFNNTGIYSGATTNTLTLNNIPMSVNGYQFRCIVSGTCTPADTSNVATLTVATPPAITLQPVNDTICTNGSTSFATAATGTQLTYQWQVNTGSGFNPIGDTGVYLGTHTPVLTLTNVPFSMNGYQYNCLVQGKCSPSVTTNAKILTVFPNPVLTSGSPTQALCNSTAFNYVPVSSVPGTTFSWTRQFNPDISTPLTADTGRIHDTLTNTSALPVNVTYIYTLTANGCTNPTTFNVVVTVNPTPILNSSLLPPAVCDNTPFDYIPTSQTPGTAFSWSRAAVTGITNAAVADTGEIHEVLVNNTPYPIDVHYIYHTAANGCLDTTDYDVLLTVKPMPRLSSPVLAGTTCSDALFSYTATSATPGTTFKWNRGSFTGVLNPPDSGFSNIIHETLVDTVAAPVGVVYVYTLTANGCVNHTNYVSVTLNPSPRLLTNLNPITCSNTTFSYTPVSTLSGTTFSWSRATVAGIANPASTGNGTINEVLINTTPNAVDVTYAYTMTSNGCSYTQNVVVTVKPLPTLSSGTTPPAACSNSFFSYTPTSNTVGTVFIWTRNAVPGITNATATGSGTINEVLMNATASAVTVPYIFNMTANGCANTQTVLVVVNPLRIPTANVTVSPNATVCVNMPVTATVTTNVTGGSYQWNVNSANVGTNSASYSYLPNWGDNIHCTVSAPAGGCYTANNVTSSDVTITVNPYDSSYVLISGNTNVLAGTPCTYVATTNMIGGTYQWKVNGVNVGTSSNTYSYIPNNGDQITCTVTAANFTCYTPNVNTSNIIAVLVTVDVKGTTSMHNIRVYPNPAKNILHIDNLSTASHFKLINVVGVTVQDGSLQSGDNFINIDEIASGIYMLELTNNTNEKAMIKVIKE